MKKIKVAIYIRVSTKKQVDEGYSLDAQKVKLEKLCETNGYIIYKIYADEGKSGKNTKRPAYQEMMEDMHNGLFDKIIVTKLDRISRSLIDLEELIQDLQKNNCSFETASEKIDLDSSIGVMFVRLLGIFAQFERERITERINDTFEEMVAQGKPITGDQPFGYKNHDGKVVINEDEKDILIDIFNTYEKMQSQRAAYTYIKNKYDVKFNYVGFGKILRNPICIGKYKTNENYTTPTISKKQYNHVQEILKSKNIKKYSNRCYLFSGLLVDVHCGTKLVGNSYHKKPALERACYYRCNKASRDRKCISTNNVNEHFLETYLLDNLEKEISLYFDTIELNYKKRVEKKADPKKKIKALKEELTRLNNVYTKGRMTEANYDLEYDRIEKEIKQLELEFKPKETTVLKELLKTDWKPIYENLSRENKQIFWRGLIDSIEIDPTKYKEGREYIKINFV